jgi:membrane-associated phospholipid phosphatase
MSFKTLAKTAYTQVKRPWFFMGLCVIGIVLATMFPSDLASYRDEPRSQSPLVHGVENYGRFVTTAAQVGLPILMRDPVGVIQNIYIGLAGTALTHGLKHGLDSVTIFGVRVGERPHGGRYNMPSGHSSLAGCAVYFVGRRYGWKHLIYLIPITLLTMFARVELDAHTWSATIAGVLVGVLTAAAFTGIFGGSVSKRIQSLMKRIPLRSR